MKEIYKYVCMAGGGRNERQ